MVTKTPATCAAENSPPPLDRTETIGEVTIEYAPGENRVRIRYPGRVDGETFRLLRQHGFRVLRSEGEGVFSAYYNNNALYFVKVHIKTGES